MPFECVMCGARIEQGILCSRCDRPRRAKIPALGSAGALAVAPAASTALTRVLVAAGVPAAIVTSERAVSFATEELTKLFGATASDRDALGRIEEAAGETIGDLQTAVSKVLHVRNRKIQFALVPQPEGAVLLYRPVEAFDAHSSFASFIRETVLHPLRSIRDSLRAANSEHAAALDQVLSSLEMAPGVEELPPATHVPTAGEVVDSVVERYRPFAEMNGVRLEASGGSIEDRIRDHDQLADALGVLLDNSLHYVPAGGQIVTGVRAMEHKGKPILLFFVMDSGPLVPEHLRQVIFEAGFVWNESAGERTGGGLARVRQFASAHGGSVWVDAREGKACTFFVRVAR